MAKAKEDPVGKNIIYSAAFPGDIIFSRQKTLVSKCFQWALGFNYSHVAVKLNSWQIIESDILGVKLQKASKYLSDNITTISIMPLPESVDAAMFINALQSKLGKQYDFGLIIGHILSKIFKISRWRENFLNASNRYTCSEFVSEALVAAGMQFEFDPSQITPKEIYYALERANA